MSHGTLMIVTKSLTGLAICSFITPFILTWESMPSFHNITPKPKKLAKHQRYARMVMWAVVALCTTMTVQLLTSGIYRDSEHWVILIPPFCLLILILMTIGPWNGLRNSEVHAVATGLLMIPLMILTAVSIYFLFNL